MNCIQYFPSRILMRPFKHWARITLVLWCGLVIVLPAATSLGQSNPVNPPFSITFQSFDYPGASTTTASGINNGNIIVGDYTDSSGKMHGYLRNFSGGYMTVDYPGAASTSLWAVNDNNHAVGYYTDSAGNFHGFFFALPGSFTPIDYPGSVFTIAYGINNSDQIVGTWADSAGNQSGFFLVNGTSFSSLSYPGAAATVASGINSSGVICGEYFDSGGLAHGFGLTRAQNGTYTTVDVPGAAQSGLDKLNDKLQVGGYTADSNGNLSGMAGVPLNHQFVAVNYPTSTATIVRGINNQPVIVGHYTDSAGKRHGFYAVQGAN